MMNLSSTLVPVPLIEPANYGSAGVDADSMDTGQLHRLLALLLFGVLVGDSVLKVYSGATAGAKTTALPFSYRFGGADCGVALADQLGDKTDVAATGLTLTAATFDHRQVAIDIDPLAVPNAQPWLTIELNSTATTLNVSGFALGVPRFLASTMPSVI